MQGIICKEPGRMAFQALPMPVPRPGEALLKVRRVGICGTDLHAFAGNQPYFSYPRVLGHELAAEAISIEGEFPGLQAGDAVAVIPYRHCGQCSACRRGFTNCCENLRVFGVHEDGGMRQYFTYPASLLLKEEGLSFDELALLEPLAIGAHAVRRAGVKAEDIVLAIGAGPIGIAVMKTAQSTGATVLAMDINSFRLNFCRNSMDIPHTIMAGYQAKEQILDITGGNLPTVVFDATGNKNALENGVSFLAHGGRYVLVGLSKGSLTFNHPAIHAKETTLFCSRNATPADFSRAAGLLRSGAFPSGAYITLEAPYEEIVTQMSEWRRPEAGLIKVMTNW
ncbi:MAG: zinc-binding alcohol dehydrogenase family protein [Phaeodactylibacter sp.]|nr:zinc-binding alcohol dehydrogenase family protein [Phaeodactylibacter sp.]MCB9266772.1 zinc-binding alcohol dehydrogenase family protein [Lewinellaceae bacterium]MCB9287234.1 zinc-binding alcohol dehydrogenase family protein [Lewinellaceae bacterium]